MLLFFSTLWAAVVGAPDSTSILQCAQYLTELPPDLTTVEVPGTCEITLRENNAPSLGTFASLKLSITNGNIVKVDPPSGENSKYTFVVSLGPKTGQFLLQNGIGMDSVPFVLLGTPDSTSLFSCSPTSVSIGQPVVCNTVPRRSNAAIWADSKFFSFTGEGFDFSSATPQWGAQFNVTGNAPKPGVYLITNGLSVNPVRIEVVGTADSTSILQCDLQAMLPGVVNKCTINANSNGQPTTVAASLFRINGIPGVTRSPLDPTTGQVFTFTLTANANAATGPVTLSDGFSPSIYMYVVAQPDGTSTLQCDPQVALEGGHARCISTPRKANQPVWCLAQSWVPKAVLETQGNKSTGSFTSLTPSYAGDKFTFEFRTLTTDTTPGTAYIADGISQNVPIQMIAPSTPDSTSVFQCPSKTLDGGTTISCISSPFKGSQAIFAKPSAFSPSDNSMGGKFEIQDFPGRALVIKYTPPILQKPYEVTISDGVSAQSAVLAVTVPQNVTFPPTSAPTTSDGGGGGGGGKSPSGLGAGGTAGVVIVVLLLVAAAVGGLIYYQKKQKEKALTEATLEKYIPLVQD